MKIFKNIGCGMCVLLEQIGDTALIAAIEKGEFVVASNLAEDGSWSSGDYSHSIEFALKSFKERIGRGKESLHERT